jgi:DNA-binding MarR family transcriptional regulator
MEAQHETDPDSISALLRAIDDAYESYAKAMGLSTSSLLVLECLWNAPDGCTQKSIAEQVFLPKQGVNLIIRSFLDKGYVTLHELERDRRAKLVTLTESGRSFAERAVGRMQRAEQATLESLTPTQRTALSEAGRSYVEQMRRALADVSAKEEPHHSAQDTGETRD